MLLEDFDLDEKVAWLLDQQPSLSLKFTPSVGRCRGEMCPARAFRTIGFSTRHRWTATSAAAHPTLPARPLRAPRL